MKLDARNIKALFRKGQALSALDEWRDAELTLNQALEHEPSNKDVQRELALLKRKVRLPLYLYQLADCIVATLTPTTVYP